MTDDEARELKSGARVEAQRGRTGREWVPAAVVSVSKGRGRPWLLLRRLDRRPDGTPWRRVVIGRWPEHVRHMLGLGPLPANVYADYLSERGEERAAQMLREAFPLDDGKETPK